MAKQYSKVELMLHPVRIRIISEVQIQPRTVNELAQVMPEVPQTTLYRYIKMLYEGGILSVAEEREVNGATERVYVIEQGRLTHEDVKSLSKDDHLQFFTMFVAGLMDTFSQYIDHNDTIDMSEAGMSYGRVVFHLTPEERLIFQQRVLDLIDEFKLLEPAAERDPFLFGSIIIPLTKDVLNTL